MKRELKVLHPNEAVIPANLIARPIPMKRELKVSSTANILWATSHCKAHPDEKGTERSR